MTLPLLSDLIDGERAAPTTDLGTWLEDPNTGQRVQPVMATDDAALDRAVAAAQRVHSEGAWAGLPAAERADWLERYADALAPRCAEVARLESLTTGAPITQTSMLSFIVHAAFRLVAEQLRAGLLTRTFDGPAGDVVVRRLPLGPALCLVPWNAPAPMASHKVASALGAGCPVILKPSELAPHGSGALADAAVEIGLPPGVFQLVHGDVRAGARLVADPRIRAVSFTGGLAGGRAIAAASVESLRPVQLELGGHNPLVVMPDADLDQAAQAVVGLMTTLNGQWCRSLGRLVVPTGLADALLERVLAGLAAVRLGGSLDPASEMGPIVHSAHLAHLRQRIEALGGTPHTATPLPRSGRQLPGAHAHHRAQPRAVAGGGLRPRRDRAPVRVHGRGGGDRQRDALRARGLRRRHLGAGRACGSRADPRRWGQGQRGLTDVAAPDGAATGLGVVRARDRGHHRHDHVLHRRAGRRRGGLPGVTARAALMVPSGEDLIGVEVYGAGPPVVLLHGSGGNRATWFQQVPLAADFTVVVVEARGSGRSTDLADSAGPVAWAADLEAVRAHLGFEAWHVVGHSSAGWTALRYAAQWPSRCLSAVALSSLAGVFPPAAVEFWSQFTAGLAAQGWGAAGPGTTAVADAWVLR